jgi:hypothetical protein
MSGTGAPDRSGRRGQPRTEPAQGRGGRGRGGRGGRRGQSGADLDIDSRAPDLLLSTPPPPLVPSSSLPYRPPPWGRLPDSALMTALSDELMGPPGTPPCPLTAAEVRTHFDLSCRGLASARAADPAEIGVGFARKTFARAVRACSLSLLTRAAIETEAVTAQFEARGRRDVGEGEPLLPSPAVPRADVLAACKELWSVISFDVLRARAESKGLGRGPVEARARQIQAAAKAAAAAAKAAAAAAVAREAAAASSPRIVLLSKKKAAGEEGAGAGGATTLTAAQTPPPTASTPADAAADAVINLQLQIQTAATEATDALDHALYRILVPAAAAAAAAVDLPDSSPPPSLLSLLSRPVRERAETLVAACAVLLERMATLLVYRAEATQMLRLLQGPAAAAAAAAAAAVTAPSPSPLSPDPPPSPPADLEAARRFFDASVALQASSPALVQSGVLTISLRSPSALLSASSFARAVEAGVRWRLTGEAEGQDRERTASLRRSVRDLGVALRHNEDVGPRDGSGLASSSPAPLAAPPPSLSILHRNLLFCAHALAGTAPGLVPPYALSSTVVAERFPFLREILRAVAAAVEGGLLPSLRVALGPSPAAASAPETTAALLQRMAQPISAALERLASSCTLALIQLDSALRKGAGAGAGAGAGTGEGGTSGGVYEEGDAPDAARTDPLTHGLLAASAALVAVADACIVVLARCGRTTPGAPVPSPSPLPGPLISSLSRALRALLSLALGLASTLMRHSADPVDGQPRWLSPITGLCTWLCARVLRGGEGAGGGGGGGGAPSPALLLPPKSLGAFLGMFSAFANSLPPSPTETRMSMRSLVGWLAPRTASSIGPVAPPPDEAGTTSDWVSERDLLALRLPEDVALLLPTSATVAKWTWSRGSFGAESDDEGDAKGGGGGGGGGTGGVAESDEDERGWRPPPDSARSRTLLQHMSPDRIRAARLRLIGHRLCRLTEKMADAGAAAAASSSSSSSLPPSPILERLELPRLYFHSGPAIFSTSCDPPSPTPAASPKPATKGAPSPLSPARRAGAPSASPPTGAASAGRAVCSDTTGAGPTRCRVCRGVLLPGAGSCDFCGAAVAAAGVGGVGAGAGGARGLVSTAAGVDDDDDDARSADTYAEAERWSDLDDDDEGAVEGVEGVGPAGAGAARRRAPAPSSGAAAAAPPALLDTATMSRTQRASLWAKTVGAGADGDVSASASAAGGGAAGPGGGDHDESARGVQSRDTAAAPATSNSAGKAADAGRSLASSLFALPSKDAEKEKGPRVAAAAPVPSSPAPSPSPSSPAPPSRSGRRLIVVDGPNVAMRAGQGARWVSAGLVKCVLYWQTKGFRVVVFAPETALDEDKVAALRRAQRRGFDVPVARIPDDVPSLRKLADKRVLFPVPARDYDDSYVIAYAQRHPGATVVTNDRYRDWVAKVCGAGGGGAGGGGGGGGGAHPRRRP